MLADFRAWLEQLARSGPELPPVGDEELESIDLFTLLGQLTALRQEVNLQTRAVRAQQEQNAQTLEQLRSALEALRATPAEEVDAAELQRPLLKTLVDLYDALSLAAREVQRLQEAVQASLDQAPPTGAGQTTLERVREWEAARERVREPVGLLARWVGGNCTAREALAAAERAITALRESATPLAPEATGVSDQARRMLESLATGYAMSLQRVERALHQHGLEPIDCVGRPFDPERMEVLEVATDTGLPAGQVVEEIRRGYLWHGHVFRYAQVRVARS